MPRVRLLLSILIVPLICSLFWRTANMQSPLKRITNNAQDRTSINPSMSGDGRVVAFESTADLANVDGPERFRAIRANINVDPVAFIQLAASRAPAPAISQDGSRIAFASTANPLGANADGNSEIFLHEAGTLRQITNTTASDISNRTIHGNFQPSISDDGRLIAFSSNRNLANENSDGNFEIFVYDNSSATFDQLTSSIAIVGFTNANISGNGLNVAYIRDTGASVDRDLLLQNRTGTPTVRVLASKVPGLQLTYGRAISDDGLRLVWSAETEINSSQVFLFDGRNNQTRQITTLGSRTNDVPLHPTISGDGSRIAFATRRTFMGNSDGSVDLYSFDIPSAAFGRITSGPSAATAEIVSSMSDDGSLVVFNFPRVLSGATTAAAANDSEIYVTASPQRPTAGTLTILNGASFGNEAAATPAIAPDSIAVARGNALAFSSQQSQQHADGSFPTTVGGTTVTINGRPAQILYVSPSQVNFLVPPQTELGMAEVVVMNSDGFQSRGNIQTRPAAPGVFTSSGDGLGAGVILNADTLQEGPFDPTNGNLRLTIFTTGVRNALNVTVSASGISLAVESVVPSASLPGLDELHVLIPVELRGAGTVDLELRADDRDSNRVKVTFAGDAARDIVINEFLADPPDANSGDANFDGIRNASQDEFIELFNSTPNDIDLSSYQLSTRSGAGAADILRHTFAPGTVLRSCSAIVVFGGGNPNPHNPVFGGSQIVTTSTGAFSLNNASGLIMLRNASGGLENFLAYGGSSGLDADENQSLTRSPDVTGSFMLHLTASAGARAFSPGAQSSGAAFNSCTPTISRVEVMPGSVAIELGQQQQFNAKAFDASNSEVPGVIFIWESDNTSVATIGPNGLATTVGPGTAQLRAVGRGVRSAPATLTVRPPPPVLTTVAITPSAATIGNGETQQFSAQAKDQFGQDLGDVVITFTSDNTTIATVDIVSSASAGSAIATVTGRAAGSAKISATATYGLTSLSSFPSMLTVEPGSGQLLISEFRTRGPAGAADEFIEIYNPTTTTLAIGGLRLRASNISGTISDRVTITPGSTLGPGCHYLLANGSSSGYSGPVTPDQTYSTGTTDDGGIALTGSNGAGIIDAVGMSTSSAFKESPTLTPLSANANHSYERKPGGGFGNGVDTNNNVADFVLTASANPQNSMSACLDTRSADLAISNIDSPDPVVTGSAITYTIVVTNNGVAVAQSVVVTDNLPDSVRFVSCGSTGLGVCSGSGNNRTVTFGSLASGASETITLVAIAGGVSGSTFTNSAAVNSSTFDADTSNNQSSTTTAVKAPLPALSINDLTANEGDSGQTTFTFTVILSSAAQADDVTFDIATQDNTAVTDDYVAKSRTTQTILAGNSSYSFEVTVNGDTLVESDESFFVNISNVSGATVSDPQAEATIQNDDAASVVISQLYGGGGNTSAPFTHDFIEIFNRGATTVNLNGWSVQYLGATGTGTWSATNLSGVIQPGQYYLAQENSGGVNGVALPTPDATGSITMAATAGKVALVSSTTPLSGSCPSGANIADLVGYGNTTSCFEGSGPSSTPSASTAVMRKAGGCVDTNNNVADSFVFGPFPRNTLAPFNDCTASATPNLTINDVSVTEGNAATTTATFTVSLSAPARGADVRFDIATADGTAQDNNPAAEDDDYVPKSLTNQIIPAGQQTFTFTVNINGDNAVEPDETFFVDITNVSGATVTDGQGQATIRNDDLPKLSINDVSLTEGDAGTKAFSFTVTLSANVGTPVTFDIATSDGTAQDGDMVSDYTRRHETAQVISAGQSTHTFDVTVKGDVNIEPNETFFVNVSNVNGALVADSQGVGTIQNDDNPSLSISDVAAAETNSGTTTLTFTVISTLPAPSGGITFDIATANHTATHDDYLPKILFGQTIPEAQTQYTFDVTVNGDTLVEPDEMLVVNISNVTNATISDGHGIGTIQNDDTAFVVISQLYGAGGNTGATLRNDFIEIFNRGTSTVDLARWSVQYTAATGTSWQVTPLCSAGPCLLVPGKYFLVQEAGGPNGQLLPAADVTGSIAMAATAGKIALVNNMTTLTGACPIGPTVLDFAAYGTTPTCFEGNGGAASPGATTADIRKGGGCVDANDNAADFFLHSPVPRNSSFPGNTCHGQTVDLSINDVTITETDSGMTSATFTVTLHGTTASTITVDYSTADNDAIAPDDYTAISATQLVFSPGETTKTITVDVKGDTLDEPNETFFVNLSNASNAALFDNQGRGTITDNDVAPELTINDVSINEGNTGITIFAFTVELSAPALTGGVTFDIASTEGTAQDADAGSEDNDYMGQSLTSQTIPAGSREFVFNVTVNGDLNIEPNETFFVNVTNVNGATIGDAQGQGTIQNDDSPTLNIDDVTANEGDAGATLFTFTVISSLPAPAGGITFDIATADGTAQDGNDYVAQSLTGQTIPEGATTYTFQVTVNGDTRNEAACETFFVNLTNATNATILDGQGQGAITDEDGTKLVISQIYGGGGNSSATYTHDFIEIFNRGNTPVNLNGMSVQYSAATSTTGSFSITVLPNVMLQPGQYFLVRQAGGATGVALPTPDATGSINLAAGAGKVALVNGTTALSAVGCPSGPAIIDFVGYGSAANCREGASTDNAPGVSNNTTSVHRDSSGCQDLNNNQQDFATAAVAPRNTASTPNTCSCVASYSSIFFVPGFDNKQLLEFGHRVSCNSCNSWFGF